MKTDTASADARNRRSCRRGEEVVRAVRDSGARHIDVEPAFCTTIAPDLVTCSLYATFQSRDGTLTVEASYGQWVCSASQWLREFQVKRARQRIERDVETLKAHGIHVDYSADRLSESVTC